MVVPSASAVPLSDAITNANFATAAHSTNDMAKMLAPPPPPRPLDSSRKTFLDLPGELRNQIYNMLLPDNDVPCPSNWDRELFYWSKRRDRRTISTDFMLACRLVHHEALDILGGWISARPATIKTDGYVLYFCRKQIRIHNLGDDALSFVKYIRSLRIFIDVGSPDYRGVCAIQDTLYDIARRLQSLRKLEIQMLLDTQKPFLLLDKASEQDSRFVKRQKEQMSCRHASLNYTCASVLAFWMDPIWRIREVTEMHQEGRLKAVIRFTKGSPHLRDDIDCSQAMSVSRERHHDYLSFAPYFDCYKQVRVLVGGLEYIPGSPCLVVFDLVKDLACARARGEMTRIGQIHRRLVSLLERELSLHSHRSSQNENILRELKDRVQELERLLPASDLKLSRFENNCMGCPTPIEQSSEGDEVGRRKGDQHERRDQLGRQGKISRWAKVLGLLLC